MNRRIKDMDHFQVAFRFNHCQALRGIEDVVSLAQMLANYGFLPAEPPDNPRPFPSIEALVDHWWKPNPRFKPEAPFNGRPQYEVFFRVIPAQFPEVLSTFRCGFYGLEHSTASLGGLLDFEFRDQSSDLESYAQELLKLALGLYPQLGPSLGWVDENEAFGRHVEETVAMELNIIGWVNFFGASFVKKYGREFLKGLPGWKVKELDDGGIFHQLTPSILASDRETTQQLQDQVVDYCRHAGLRVQCRGPYMLQPLRHIQEEAKQDDIEGYGTDEDLKVYLQQILSSTLTLKDGTRVKPIYIEWDLLTPEQRQIALSFVKQAAISEIREQRSTRIRFEFNEIPTDLDRMMRDLVGVNSPSFAYAQVDMN
jgi:hypothetical protein